MKQTAHSVDPQFAAGASSSLYNDDLAPTTPAQRTWKWYHFAALWVGMVMNIASYMLAAGLTEEGMSPWQAVITVLLGNMIVLVPMLLVGHAGAKHGIPYAVLVRSSFGTKGAKLPALLRAIVACGWYGIQTWLGGSGDSTRCSTSWPAIRRMARRFPSWTFRSASSHVFCFSG